MLSSDEKCHLEDQLSTFRKRYDSMMDENNSLIRWRSEMESEITHAKDQHQMLDQEATISLDTLRNENNMLREYTKKSAEEIAELKDVIRLAEDNDLRNSRHLEQLEFTKVTLLKESDDLKKTVEHYKQICVQNESYIKNLMKERDFLNQKLNEATVRSQQQQQITSPRK